MKNNEEFVDIWNTQLKYPAAATEYSKLVKHLPEEFLALALLFSKRADGVHQNPSSGCFPQLRICEAGLPKSGRSPPLLATVRERGEIGLDRRLQHMFSVGDMSVSQNRKSYHLEDYCHSGIFMSQKVSEVRK